MNGFEKDSFSSFFSSFGEIETCLDYYSDFGKIIENVEEISMHLNQLNYLIGKTNMREAVTNLWQTNKKCFKVLGILIAVRKNQNKKALGRDGVQHSVYSFFESIDSIMEFIEDTGLIKILQNNHVKNLVDYVYGVETGLDSHARKNRMGDIMSKIIRSQFDEAGILYEKEVAAKKIPAISGALGMDKKKFDFVIKTKQTTYLIEVNYYSSKSGSKVTEIHRSYMKLDETIRNVDGFEFVWITDGPAWKSAEEQLHEAYSEMSNIYNIKTTHKLINKIKTEGNFSNKQLSIAFE